MNHSIRLTVAGSLALLAQLIAAPSQASQLIYSSAGFVANGETGDYSLANDAQSLIAATFTLTQTTSIDAIGGVFTQYGDGGAIFGAIIAAPGSQTSVTAASLPGLTLGAAVWAPPVDGSDATTTLSTPTLLGPGTYEVVFGSGLFGATGNSGLATGMSGTANLLQSVDGGASWNTLNDSVRVTVYGTPVPLPAGLPLLFSGLTAMGWLRRRSRSGVPATA